MKIVKSQYYAAQQAINTTLQPPRHEAVQTDKPVAETTDQVGLSEKARFMSQVKQTLVHGDEVRADKVEYYRNLIEKGEFVVDADWVAARMVEELM